MDFIGTHGKTGFGEVQAFHFAFLGRPFKTITFGGYFDTVRLFLNPREVINQKKPQMILKVGVGHMGSDADGIGHM